MLSDGSARYLYGHERLAAQAAGTTTWYAHDALGSVRQTLDNAGAPLATATYDPWGTPEGGSISPFGFTGELQDAAGLVYLRARWYTPQTGTLLSRDPFAGFPAQPFSLHPYQYAYGNPVNWSDPSGAVVIALPVVVGGALAVLALAGMVTAATPPHQAAIQDATDSLGILFDEDAQTQARFQAIATAVQAFEHLAEVAWRNEGFQLDDEPNGLQVLIFVVTSAPCFLNEGFALQAPSLDDVIRLGPSLTNILSQLSTAHPLPQEVPQPVLQSANQMNEEIRRGIAPRRFERVDPPRIPFEKLHVHLRNGAALNHDGTWKHGPVTQLSSKEKKWLEKWGWTPPKD